MSESNAALANFKEIAERALSRARRWADASNKYPMEQAAKLLANVLEAPGGLDYTVAFVDGVVRPEDKEVAAEHLAKIGAQNPEFLPWYLRTPALVGGVLGKHVPKLSVPAARKVFATLVGDLVVDVTDAKLGPAIQRLRANGSRLNMNLLGEAVLGEKEAARRLNDTLKLLKRDDVDYVSLKVSAVTGPHNAWGYQQVVDHAVEQLLPLYQYAAASGKNKFINLDMEEYRDLNITIDVFKKILDREELLGLEAGIVLQAYLPDTLDSMKDLQAWARQRRARGGAAIKVRVVKGANLAMERVDALMHGWSLTTWESKQATDANYLRILDWSLQPENIENIRIGVAGHNLFTVATAWEMALDRGVTAGVEIEMLSGMATQQASAVREDIGSLLLYVPVVHPDEYDVAIAYLVRRLEENSADENFMASIFDIGTNVASFEKEKERFLNAVEQLETEGDSRVGANRKQNRQTETTESLTAEVQDENGQWVFENIADSDPSLEANLAWAQQIAARIPSSTLGVETAQEAEINNAEELDQFIRKIELGARTWAAKTAAERADVLHRAGVEIARRRADLIEVAGSELGKGLDQADVEVSEAADFAHYYAEQALELEKVNGANFKPVGITLITPPWNFPLAIPAGGVLAALAAGSGVILKPASVSKRCGAVIAECLWAAGVPADVLGLVNVGERELGKELVTDKRVERVVLTGGAETAELFRSWDPTMKLMAETSGKNSIIVTPSADLDLAVKDIVNSAFGHAGQKCSACSNVILVGSAGFSKRVRNQLIDAVKSLNIGWADDLSVQMGPLSVKPGEKLMRGLTTLEPGQRWVIEPKQLDETGRLWSPGVRAGVEAGSEFHLTEYFGPLLGIMRVDTLEEAIFLQNMTDYGLTAGLHSLDAEEINLWLNNVEAGNVYVNRGITGAIVQRQPFGGWKRSVVGEGAKAGGPNYLFGFGTFENTQLEPIPAGESVQLKSQYVGLLEVAKEHLDEEDFNHLLQVVKHDAYVTAKVFDELHDPSDIPVERNILRYLPAETTVRFGKDSTKFEIFRVLSAGLSVGAFAFFADDNEAFARFLNGGGFDDVALIVSSSDYLPTNLVALLNKFGVETTVENEAQFQRSLLENHYLGERVRLVGENGDALRRAVGGSIDIAIFDDPVTDASRIEILPFVHEQAVSITNHRFGNRTPLSAEVLADRWDTANLEV
ncbi:bifunctional proline dehydrogenase/L-glutamate gamma-semialdehyde dehydrogenase [Gleimia sp. 6138-11-ORH1]|uniref:bifunctional proline dehydrogenase/L-glutamate gamma-semialdehyde dehydrogenase n=1 Tax=Gleimia sp. 6138-11-ORH1 TaxID=2973937 RepID=UPI002169B7E4|nr:bifunctional proline dehydrogenase/L-glutamate gamma-semialdehyde dehydrogenase [Gleimia sp. 6138-11-ORH1]MCS4485024.1 bifunctional proline dehydrogenase/L-glutamate gamma-semialdehyde dehydrogenase [Gleimia sp. 6138-11-ORH1]